jgi:uncharacterized protein YndB with AHSA1/START domain
VSSTRISRRVNASRAIVYRTLLDARAVATWMVPTGMTGHVNAFDTREGGSFRISLKYDAPAAAGMNDRTHRHAPRPLREARDERAGCRSGGVRDDRIALHGEMTITISLADADGGTDVLAVHDGLPRGVPTAENAAGWRSSLAKLAALVEAG